MMSSSDDATSPSQGETYRARARIANVFRPAAPVRSQDLFVGRKQQIEDCMRAILEVGRHVAIFGERGVGKTSLANVLVEILRGIDNIAIGKAGANAQDSFESVLLRVFRDIAYHLESYETGFGGASTANRVELGRVLQDTEAGISYDAALTYLRESNCVLVIDEFDRLPTIERDRFTDLVKAVSDAGSSATIIFVGVAESVQDLLSAHGSLGRNLAQVEMPRMGEPEILAILATAERIPMRFSDPIASEIVRLSQGLPHYTHFLALHSCYSCASRRIAEVDARALDEAISEALKGAAATIQSAYRMATSSAHRDALYAQVLLAAALAVQETELPFGEFRPAQVVAPFRSVTGDASKDVSSFNNHLTAFATEESRGPILLRLGVERNYRFRFRDPMLPPYVLMLAHKENKLPARGA